MDIPMDPMNSELARVRMNHPEVSLFRAFGRLLSKTIITSCVLTPPLPKKKQSDRIHGKGLFTNMKTRRNQPNKAPAPTKYKII